MNTDCISPLIATAKFAPSMPKELIDKWRYFCVFNGRSMNFQHSRRCQSFVSIWVSLSSLLSYLGLTKNGDTELPRRNAINLGDRYHCREGVAIAISLMRVGENASLSCTYERESAGEGCTASRPNNAQDRPQRATKRLPGVRQCRSCDNSRLKVGCGELREQVTFRSFGTSLV